MWAVSTPISPLEFEFLEDACERNSAGPALKGARFFDHERLAGVPLASDGPGKCGRRGASPTSGLVVA